MWKIIWEIRLRNGRDTIQRVQRLGNCNCIQGTSVHAAMGNRDIKYYIYIKEIQMSGRSHHRYVLRNQRQPVLQQGDVFTRPVVENLVEILDNKQVATLCHLSREFRSLTIDILNDRLLERLNKGKTFYNNINIFEIRIPDGLVNLWESTFYECTNLATIILPKSLTSIGKTAFANCHSLRAIDLPSSVTTIGAKAFINCESLNFITWPPSMMKIEERCFRQCTRLTNINLRMTKVTRIELAAFSGCIALTKVTLPNSLQMIDTMAFEGCTTLSEIGPFTEKFKSIGHDVFKKCNALKRINLQRSTLMTSMDAGAFAYSSGLQEIILPSSVTAIESKTFYGCTSLTNINLSMTKVERIERAAFSGCVALTTVTLPTSLRTINTMAFENCTALINIGPFTNKFTSFLHGCTDNCIVFAYNVFNNCIALQEIDLHNTSIDRCMRSDTFGACPNLQSIILPNILSNCDHRFIGCPRATVGEVTDLYGP